MTADTADIRFECDKCGQHLVVEAAAAGLTADCPICNTTVTVPEPARADGGKKRHANGAAEGAVPFADPGPDELREELIDASMLNGKLLADLERARGETARVQLQLKDLAEEHERLNATATHAQRELKTFQTERQQLKGEMAVLRQRLGVAEEAAAARVVELQAVRGELETRQQEIARLSDSLDQTRAQLAAEISLREGAQTRLGETEARLGTTAADLDGALNRLAQTETTLQQLRESSAALEQERGELRTRLEDAGARLVAAAEIGVKLEATEALLRDERAKSQVAEEANRALTERCETLTREGEVMRNDLKGTASGREMTELRELLAGANAERERITSRLQEIEAELQKANAAGETLRTERDDALRARNEAREEAAALRDSQELKDNDVLRGIISRLNAELAQRTSEATRLKRAQYSLKIVYGIFGIGLLAVCAFALKVLPKFIH